MENSLLNHGIELYNYRYMYAHFWFWDVSKINLINFLCFIFSTEWFFYLKIIGIFNKQQNLILLKIWDHLSDTKKCFQNIKILGYSASWASWICVHSMLCFFIFGRRGGMAEWRVTFFLYSLSTKLMWIYAF